MTGIAARFRRAHRALRTAAVTGTNGKTTTTAMIAAIVAASGETAARVTNAGAWIDEEQVFGRNRSEEFLLTVERAVAAGARTLALEMTSKALASGIAKRWRPTVGVFTNLTRDHMETHGTVEAYLASKAQLFMALPSFGVAVLNGDDSASDLLREVLPPGIAVLEFSVADAGVDLAAKNVMPTRRGTTIELFDSRMAKSLGGELSLGVVGSVHAQNALGAALATEALGYGADVIRTGLQRFRGVPGRFEIVVDQPLVVVDYAHTPDGLVGTLDTARSLVEKRGRLICVFGCAGNRDPGKRPIMGAVVAERADLAILTTDNPRGEDPAAIAADVRPGLEGYEIEWSIVLDRRSAIRRASEMADADDVVVIAGKGHEAVQEVGSEEIPFSDAVVARELWGLRTTSEGGLAR